MRIRHTGEIEDLPLDHVVIGYVINSYKKDSDKPVVSVHKDDLKKISALINQTLNGNNSFILPYHARRLLNETN